jgi:polar amino acid transport system substrate-binding protein
MAAPSGDEPARTHWRDEPCFPAMNRILSLLLVMFLLLAGSAPALALDKVRLQLKWHHQFQFAGYYAAIEQGYFAAEGIDVELIERDVEINNILQVVNGAADYGIADSVLLLYQEQGAGLRIVAPIFQHSPNVIITLASSGIVAPQDLVGRRVRLYNNETEGFPIMAMLAEQGVFERGFIRQPYSMDFGVLARGETDAIYGYSSNEPFLLRQQGLDVHLIHPAHYGIDMYGDMLFTSEREAREHPARVRAMRRAVLRGWEYALDHKEAIARLILDKYSQRKPLEALLYEAQAIEQAVARFTVPLGTLDSGRLQYISGIYARHGLLDKHFSPDHSVFFDRQPGDGMSLTEEEQAFLQQLRVIRVGVDREWYPLDFVDAEGRHSGIAADYLNLLSQRLGITFEVETRQPWPRVLEMVRERELDMFAMAASTPERTVYAGFTQPYIRSPMVIVTNTDADYIADGAELRGKRVAVVKGYASHDWLAANHPELDLHLVDTTVNGLERVATGEMYAFVDNLASVSFLIKQQGLSNLKVSGQFPMAFDLAMGARSDWPLLRGILQKGLDSITQEERDAIYNKWVRLEYETRIDFSRVAPYFIGLLLVLMLVMLDTWRVRRLHRRLHGANQQLQRAKDQLRETNRELERLAITDKLTGVYNRLKLDAVLSQQAANVQRYGRALSVVIFDLDNFKQVNDTYGHHVGDTVLQSFAQLVLNNIRKSDIFGRWGGEEFLLLCPETDVAGAMELAEKIRVQTEALPFAEGFVQTISCGVAQLREGQSLLEWLVLCDKLLYLAKKSGRNRVVTELT